MSISVARSWSRRAASVDPGSTPSVPAAGYGRLDTQGQHSTPLDDPKSAARKCPEEDPQRARPAAPAQA